MKKTTGFFMIIILLFGLCGCGSRNQDTISKLPNAGNGSVNIFYPEDEEVKCESESYQLKQPDSLTASVEEVMSAITGRLDGAIKYHTYMMDADNNISLEFAVEGETDKEYTLLVQAAVCRTLQQLKELGSINIRLVGLDGNVLSEQLFLNNSLYYYDYPDSFTNEITITLYVPDSTGTKLIRTEQDIVLTPNDTLEALMVKKLDSLNFMPEGTEVNSVIISDGICYLNMNAEFNKSLNTIKSDVVIYSIVNSIVSLEEIDSVVIMIDGKKDGLYRESVDLSGKLGFNSYLVTEE